VRAVTFGELLLRLSPPGEERLLVSPKLETCFGGAEANVAVGLAHLGVACDYVTRIPENPLGGAGLEALRREGVGTTHVLRGGQRLGLYFVESGDDLRAMRVVYDRAGSAFAQLEPAMLDWSAILKGAAWFHSTGITPALGEGPRAALAAAISCARSASIRVSLDLNFRAALWQNRDPMPTVRPLAEQADLVIGNADAIKTMLGMEADPQRVAERLGERGGRASRFVAITEREHRGPRDQTWSAALYDVQTGHLHRSRRHEVRVVDRVGGGDSFTAALIAQLLAGNEPAEALEFAVAASALKLTIPGDFCRVSAADVVAWRQR
jgi:2-dehydro-3-deoxygluconokinase